MVVAHLMFPRRSYCGKRALVFGKGIGYQLSTRSKTPLTMAFPVSQKVTRERVREERIYNLEDLV